MFIVQIIVISVGKYGVKCRTSLRDWINEQTLMVGFRGILDAGWVEDQKMMKDKLMDRKEL